MRLQLLRSLLNNLALRLNLAAFSFNRLAVTFLIWKGLAAVPALRIGPVFRHIRLLRHVNSADVLSHLSQSFTDDAFAFSEELPVTSSRVFRPRVFVLMLPACHRFL